MMDLELDKLKVTDLELSDLVLDPRLIIPDKDELDIAHLARMCRDAQFVKALCGIQDWIEERFIETGGVDIADKFATFLKESGIS